MIRRYYRWIRLYYRRTGKLENHDVTDPKL